MALLASPLDQTVITPSIRATTTIAMPPHPSASLAPLPSGVPPPPSLGSVVVPCREKKKKQFGTFLVSPVFLHDLVLVVAGFVGPNPVFF